jgi:predicted tellurium resistance membrane protein TerC
MSELLTTEAFSALLQVIMIDLVLTGDNAVVIGLAAAGLPKEQRNKAILIGIIAATVLRIVFARLTTHFSRSSVCFSPVAFSCCGYAGRCGGR